MTQKNHTHVRTRKGLSQNGYGVVSRVILHQLDVGLPPLIITAEVGLVNRPHLLFGGVSSVTTYPSWKWKKSIRDCKRLSENDKKRKLDGMESSKSKSDAHYMHGWHKTHAQLEPRDVVCNQVKMTTTRTNKKTTCTLTCQVSRFMCTVWVLVVTSSLVSAVLSFGFTTRTQSKFLLEVAVRLYFVIVNSYCSHNYCLLHIAKTGHLRCCL